MGKRILVVDDDPWTRQILSDKLGHVGFDVLAVSDAEEGLGRLDTFEPAILITDIRLPGMDGLSLLKRVRSSGVDLDVFVITGHEDMRTAIEAMKAGAYDYVTKPLNLDELQLLVERCIREQDLRRRAMRQAEEASDSYAIDVLMVGKDPRVIAIYKLIGVLAQNRATVLIRGETGTGKERIARSIHFNSPCVQEPFIAVNCTALSSTLLESELFGHVRGAFTGAVTSRRGYFELAGSGSIFLDEIGDTSAEFQSKLLRVLEDREFYPVGGETSRHTDARVLAATHRPVEELVKTGAFREDLYYRLKVVEINVPPLRDRRSDIPVLAHHLLARIGREIHKDVDVISDDALAMLSAYDWPGNVRELQNVLTHAAVLARGPAISAEHVHTGVTRSTPSDSAAPVSQTLEAAIGAHVQRVLHATGGNKSEAARTLDISRSRLDRVISKHDLKVPG